MLAIVATGPGVFSLDAAYGATQWGGGPAVLALAVGLITGALVLNTRRHEAEVEDDVPATESSRVEDERRAA
jgi:hypothetical protein